MIIIIVVKIKMIVCNNNIKNIYCIDNNIGIRWYVIKIWINDKI